MIGKKLGIVSIVCAVLVIVFAFIGIDQAPEIDKEVYEIMATDVELANEMLEEIDENSSLLYKISDIGISILSLVGIVIAIVAIVKMTKGKEKGKIIPVLAIIIIIVSYFVYIFEAIDADEAFKAGLEAGMSMQEE